MVKREALSMYLESVFVNIEDITPDKLADMLCKNFTILSSKEKETLDKFVQKVETKLNKEKEE